MTKYRAINNNVALLKNGYFWDYLSLKHIQVLYDELGKKLKFEWAFPDSEIIYK